MAFQDSEAFDGGLLGDLLCLMRYELHLDQGRPLIASSWLDRIPFVLLFGVATSIDIFQAKLSRAAIRCIQGDQFDVEPVEASLERVFSDAVGPESLLRPGPALSKLLLDRQRDHVQSTQAFASALKVSPDKA